MKRRGRAWWFAGAGYLWLKYVCCHTYNGDVFCIFLQNAHLKMNININQIPQFDGMRFVGVIYTTDMFCTKPKVCILGTQTSAWRFWTSFSPIQLQSAWCLMHAKYWSYIRPLHETTQNPCPGGGCKDCASLLSKGTVAKAYFWDTGSTRLTPWFVAVMNYIQFLWV